MTRSRDAEKALKERLLCAGEEGIKCVPVGHNSKAQFDASNADQLLSTSDFRGISAYEPTELVITAGAGTPFSEVEQVLREGEQVVGFEALNRRAATLGGAIACGLCGPARPFLGAVRDFVLGVEVMNGRGQHLRFGGQVIKNVAGYDVSRLYSGSWGTLGIILSVSMRVVPKHESEITLGIECGLEAAIVRLCEFAASPLPLSGAAYHDGLVRLRLSGFETAVKAAQRRVGATKLADQQEFWSSITDASHAFFKRDEASIYRLSLPPATPHLDIPGDWLIDWGGALRWLKTEVPRNQWQQLVTQAGGSLLPWPARREDWLTTGERSIDRLQSRIREAFDPSGVFW